MERQANRKKLHHFVHRGYLDAWRTAGVLYVYNRKADRAYPDTGGDSGARTGFNVFSFDETVVESLRYAFEGRPGSPQGTNVYRMMLAFIDVARDMEYPHKHDNLIEDFYSIFETDIGKALDRVERGRPLIDGDRDARAFDDLVLFFCLQLFRTPKARDAVAREVAPIHWDGQALDDRQRSEFIMMHSLISALAMWLDLLDKGCEILLRKAQGEESLINSDAPVVLIGAPVARLEDLRGSVPLNPRMLMEIGRVGSARKRERRSLLAPAEVENFNRLTIANADQALYFGSERQRAKYADLKYVDLPGR